MANHTVSEGVVAKLQPSLEFQDTLKSDKAAVKIAPAMFSDFFSNLDAIFAQDTRQNIQVTTVATRLLSV